MDEGAIDGQQAGGTFGSGEGQYQAVVARTEIPPTTRIAIKIIKVLPVTQILDAGQIIAIPLGNKHLIIAADDIE